MNWKQIVEGVRSGEIRVEYRITGGAGAGVYRVERLVLAGGYRDWRRVRVGSAAIYRALRELHPATHCNTGDNA